jgi:hypothetical protein
VKKNRTARTEQQEEDSRNKTKGSRQQEQDIQYSTVRIGQLEQGSQSMTAGAGKPGQDCQNRTSRIGCQDMTDGARQDRTTKARQQEYMTTMTFRSYCLFEKVTLSKVM